MRIDPVKFYEKNKARNWITEQGTPVKEWKKLLWRWNDKEDIKKTEPDKNSFQQNVYDFEKLEKELRRN